MLTLTQDYTVKLDCFEGPMDILLYLIKKEKLDIYEIPLALITEQYLEHIRIMPHINLDVAGDFLIMASHLIQLKSRSLLNKDTGEEEEDPEELKKALLQRLIEYQACKKGAEILKEYEIERHKLIPSAGIPLHEPEEMVEADLFDLFKAYYQTINNQEENHKEPERRISIDSIIILEEKERILSTLRVNKKIFFRLLLKNNEKKHFVISFLAVLELVKIQKVKIFQERHFGEILLQLCM